MSKEETLDQKTTGEEKSLAPVKKAQKKKRVVKPDIRLPGLLEMAFTASRLVVVLAGVAVLLISLQAGCPFWLSGVKAGTSVLVLGGICYLISLKTVRGFFDTHLGEDEGEDEDEDEISLSEQEVTPAGVEA